MSIETFNTIANLNIKHNVDKVVDEKFDENLEEISTGYEEYINNIGTLDQFENALSFDLNTSENS